MKFLHRGDVCSSYTEEMYEVPTQRRCMKFLHRDVCSSYTEEMYVVPTQRCLYVVPTQRGGGGGGGVIDFCILKNLIVST